jgi:hypothetical protein
VACPCRQGQFISTDPPEDADALAISPLLRNVFHPKENAQKKHRQRLKNQFKKFTQQVWS